MRQIHLVRHGEVHNPLGVIYGRLPEFPLSARGRAMAEVTASSLAARGRSVGYLFSSPLERAVQSAEPIAAQLGLDIQTRPGLIEAASHLEGQQVGMSLTILAKPHLWRYLYNPFVPSWGEPFRSVAERMSAELARARHLDGDDDVVIVSHQLPIWMMHRVASGAPLRHDPRRRRCALSSVTTVTWSEGRWVEVGYADPAVDIPAVDAGSV